MSSMKKNVLAAALVAGMGMAGWAAAESTPGNLSNFPFQYGGKLLNLCLLLLILAG